MSHDIDMEQYGRAYEQPAAAVQQQQKFESNSFIPDEEYPVRADLLDAPAVPAAPESNAPVPDINPQADHFRALREEVDRIKTEKEAEKKDYQLQIDMLRSNINQQSKTPSVERKMFDGMDDSDVPNVRELRNEWNAREQGYKQRLDELQTQSQHSDYHEMLNNYLTPLLRQKPYLAQGIQASDSPSLYAYELAKMYQSSQQVHNQPSASIQTTAPQQSENARRMVDNSRKIGTLSQVGGQNSLSQADYFASMSDQEFMRMASKNLEGI